MSVWMDFNLAHFWSVPAVARQETVGWSHLTTLPRRTRAKTLQSRLRRHNKNFQGFFDLPRCTEIGSPRRRPFAESQTRKLCSETLDRYRDTNMHTIPRCNHNSHPSIWKTTIIYKSPARIYLCTSLNTKVVLVHLPYPLLHIYYPYTRTNEPKASW
jgi:hypothetical protein